MVYHLKLVERRDIDMELPLKEIGQFRMYTRVEFLFGGQELIEPLLITITVEDD